MRLRRDDARDAPTPLAPRRPGPRVAWLAALLLLGCGPRVRPTPRPPLVAAPTEESSAVEQAQWRYHPRGPATLRARVPVGDGWLFVGDEGERWLVDGKVAAAASRPRETLVGAQPGGEGWVFLGSSGTIYEAREPLGPVLRSAAPATPMVQVTVTDQAVLGVRAGGRLSRSTNLGVLWSESGPPGALFASAALDARGRGVAVGVPERLYFSRDHGATWGAEANTPRGVLSVRREGTELRLEGALGDYRLGNEWPPALLPVPRGAPESPLTLGQRLPRGPDANAIAAGRAVIVGRDYFELVRSEGRDPGLTVLTGPLGGPLRRRPLAAARGCYGAKLAAHGPHLVIACIESASPPKLSPLTFLRSDDRGRTWAKESLAAAGSLAQLRLAVGPQGELVVSGICVKEEPQARCRPFGLHYRGHSSPASSPRRETTRRRAGATRPTPEPDRPRLLPAVTPALRDVALALTFGPSGRAYAIGRRSKAGDLAAYVSDDGGKTFTGRELALGAGDREQEEEGAYEPSPELEVSSFVPGDDGLVALVLQRWDSSLYALLDSDGRLLSRRPLPEGVLTLAAAGRRALGHAPEDGAVWESLDGGVSWQAAGYQSLRDCEPEDEDRGPCRVRMACQQAGCVLGRSLTRLGWGADPGAGTDPVPVPETRLQIRPLPLRTPIGCTLSPGAWTPLRHATAAPRAAQAAIGVASWFAPAEDPVGGAVGVWTGSSGAKPGVEYLSLLPATRDPQRYAQRLSPQIEGAASLRYRVPDATNTNLTEVEVAWQNLMESTTVRRARLPRSLPYHPGDFQRGRRGTQRAAPALLSIATGGVYLRPHANPGNAQTTYFLDGRAIETVAPIPWPEDVRAAGHAEIARLDGHHVPFLVANGGATLVRATQSGSSWSFAAISLGLITPQRLGLLQDWSIAYREQTPGLVLHLLDPVAGVERRWLHPLATTSAVTLPPVALPGQSHLDDPPRACTTEQRRGSPRAVAAELPGAHHPVLITEAREPLRALLTGEAVLHGTPEQPCAAAFEATGVAAGATEPEALSAILPLDALDQSWLFRSSPSDRPEGTLIEVRPMSCRFEPGAELPEELLRRSRSRRPPH